MKKDDEQRRRDSLGRVQHMPSATVPRYVYDESDDDDGTAC